MNDVYLNIERIRISLDINLLHSILQHHSESNQMQHITTTSLDHFMKLKFLFLFWLLSLSFCVEKQPLQGCHGLPRAPVCSPVGWCHRSERPL